MLVLVYIAKNQLYGTTRVGITTEKARRLKVVTLAKSVTTVGVLVLNDDCSKRRDSGG